MTLNEYQERAMGTCMPSCKNFTYMMLNLVGEVGELAGKVAKAVRHETAMIDTNRLITERGMRSMTDEQIADLRKEAGDVLWQLAGLCKVMGWTLEDVAEENLRKLADRKGRGVIDGSGDNR
jgi:NTP pyrophosphatase (non-canonical NTP hydrolase)